MEDLKQIIAHNLAELRRGVGMTQLELAEQLNYSDKAVSKWERGESLPDITVLKAIADLFSVTVDYLITAEHPEPVSEPLSTFEDAPALLANPPANPHVVFRRHAVITGLSILLVWLISTLLFIIFELAPATSGGSWLSFVYAIPTSMLVWLIMNSIWFNRRRNFLIVSLLMWSLLAAVYLSVLLAGYNLWLLFVLGIPGQAIILLWSRMKKTIIPRPAENENDT